MRQDVVPSRRFAPTRRGERQLVHLLNQRYRAEFDRAERLQAELDDIHASKAWRLLAWARRWRRRLMLGTSHNSPLNPPWGQPLACRPVQPRGLVSIVIPFRDHAHLLRACLQSLRRSTYSRFELVLVDNGSTEPAMARLLQRLEGRRRVLQVRRPEPFNFSRLCNAGAERAQGDYLLFLNQDTEVLAPDWLEHLLLVAAQPRIGVVGATLFYPDSRIQHAGMVEHVGRWQHIARGLLMADDRLPKEIRQTRIVSAVTAACLLIHRELFHALKGFDERYPVTHNDVDLCRRVREHGLRIAVSPHAQLLHYESVSRGYQREHGS
jgi:GT2 family glycosyltransferase